jgi:hypothetical protein
MVMDDLHQPVLSDWSGSTQRFRAVLFMTCPTLTSRADLKPIWCGCTVEIEVREKNNNHIFNHANRVSLSWLSMPGNAFPGSALGFVCVV